MPYITKDKRDIIEPEISNAVKIASISSVGELNYTITRLVDTFLQNNKGYAGINSAIGVLECAKLELYRRVGAPLEDEKKILNGEVYLEKR